MPAAIFTIAILGVMALGLARLARSWPHSSRYTGFRITEHGGSRPASPIVPEDDDAHWNWRRRRA